MKKRILTILLSALLVANINACSYVPKEDIHKETSTNENSGTKDSSTNDAQNNNNANNETDLIQISTYTTQNLLDTLQLSNAFSSVLKSEATIWDSTNSSFTYLNNLIIGSEYAYVSALDLDEVNGNEVIVIESSEDVIILKEHEGMIYAWQYRHTALYNLRVDGTYNWSEQGGNIYGSAKLQFDGASKSSIELDRVAYNEEFYINEIEVSQDAFQVYVQNQMLAKEANRYWWKTGVNSSDYQANGK